MPVIPSPPPLAVAAAEPKESLAEADVSVCRRERLADLAQAGGGLAGAEGQQTGVEPALVDLAQRLLRPPGLPSHADERRLRRDAL
jgi:hypothetical protein